MEQVEMALRVKDAATTTDDSSVNTCNDLRLTTVVTCAVCHTVAPPVSRLPVYQCVPDAC